MDLFADGLRKYGGLDVISTSRRLAWHGLVADLRHHEAAELPPFEPQALEICIAVACHDDCVVTRRGQGVWQRTQVEPGIIWLCPSRVQEEDIRISEWHDILHLYLPADGFSRYAGEYGGTPVSADSVRYLAGVRDDLIRQAGWRLISEMREPTSTAQMRVQSLSQQLTGRIVERYASSYGRVDRVHRQHQLDEQRLRRVLEFMAQHIEEDISLDDLAAAACLSPFHFNRMFTRRMGMPPHRYVSRMRLERAKTLLALGRVPLAEIALACCFSSQSNFSRAFRRVTGESPLNFRRHAGQE
ncbi:AraC family transcriptional regulator [Alsobacter sp. KACC 23698]|uniref:AraC family transcriptional regulator n=1 Tax=Alsobacter sp. KACC 23698 TaxID=3149229 RepID=A0AAU7JKH8_9HYPH